MKKATVLLLTAVLLLGLAACGETQPDPTEAPVETPASVQTEAPDPTEAPAEEDESLLETAKSFEGKPLEELIAAIGGPLSSDYAPSCLGDGEDGNLYYDGFTVYTYRDEGGETVNYVE